MILNIVTTDMPTKLIIIKNVTHKNNYSHDSANCDRNNNNNHNDKKKNNNKSYNFHNYK